MSRGMYRHDEAGGAKRTPKNSLRAAVGQIKPRDNADPRSALKHPPSRTPTSWALTPRVQQMRYWQRMTIRRHPAHLGSRASQKARSEKSAEHSNGFAPRSTTDSKGEWASPLGAELSCCAPSLVPESRPMRASIPVAETSKPCSIHTTGSTARVHKGVVETRRAREVAPSRSRKAPEVPKSPSRPAPLGRWRDV